MTASATPQIPSPPHRWEGVLSGEQWLVAVDAIGAERLEDLHPVLTQVSPRFRESFVTHLHAMAAFYPDGRATLIALARATDEAADRACAATAARTNRPLPQAGTVQ